MVWLLFPWCLAFPFTFPKVIVLEACHLLASAVLIKLLYIFGRWNIRNGPWAPKVPVPAEKRQKAGRDQEE